MPAIFPPVVPHNLIRANWLVVLMGGGSLQAMGTATSASFSEAPGSEPRTLVALLLESIALRHQIPVLSVAELVARAFAFGDFVLALVAAMARQPAGDSLALAP